MFVFSSEPELSGFGKIVKKNAMIFAMDFAAKDAAEVKSSADKNSVVKGPFTLAFETFDFGLAKCFLNA